MDADGYPDEDELEKIQNWDWRDYHGLMAYVHNLWRYPDFGFERDGEIYRLSTAGWSGNEEIINAMQHNHLFWARYWYASRRGGHYVFAPIGATIVPQD